MKIIPREARKITYSTEIRDLKKRLTLTDTQKAFVVGTILGDANLELNWSKTNYRLRFGHSAKQKDYVFWKYDNLKDWVLTAPRYYSKTNSYFFNTVSHTDITSLAKIFLKNGKKIIPENIKELLENPFTLAVWFMDDGNAVKRTNKLVGFHLNTQSFSLEENIKLKKLLKDLYNLDSSLELNHNKHRLGIWKAASRNIFMDIVSPFIIPSMKYKLT